jgi:SNF2 family DNA or RNA helicase
MADEMGLGKTVSGLKLEFGKHTTNVTILKPIDAH